MGVLFGELIIEECAVIGSVPAYAKIVEFDQGILRTLWTNPCPERWGFSLSYTFQDAVGIVLAAFTHHDGSVKEHDHCKIIIAVNLAVYSPVEKSGCILWKQEFPWFRILFAAGFLSFVEISPSVGSPVFEILVPAWAFSQFLLPSAESVLFLPVTGPVMILTVSEVLSGLSLEILSVTVWLAALRAVFLIWPVTTLVRIVLGTVSAFLLLIGHIDFLPATADAAE